MIQYVAEGHVRGGVLYIDKHRRGGREGRRPPRRLHARVGRRRRPTRRSTRRSRAASAKAGMISIPLTIIILMLVLGSLVAALDPADCSRSRPSSPRSASSALASQAIPASENIMEVVLLVGLAVGVDYSLFYMRREREERAAGRTEGAALRGRRRDVRTCRARLGHHRPDRDGGDVPLGRQDVHVLLGRHDDRRRRRDARLAHRPARRARPSSATRSRRAGSRSLGRRRTAGESRIWGASSTRVLRRPLVSAVAATRGAARPGRSRRSACTRRRPASRASRARRSSRSRSSSRRSPARPTRPSSRSRPTTSDAAQVQARDRRAEARRRSRPAR